MKKEDIIQFAAALPGAVCDYPFREERDIAVLRHAITVRLDGSVPDEEIEKLVRLSYDITSAGNRKRK